MMPPAIRNMFTEETEEELLNMSREEVTKGMNDKEILFCQYYMKDYNIKMAAIKAGYKSSSAHMSGYKLRRRKLVNRYIAWLKLRVGKMCHVDAMDVIEQYMRIAFADITSFADFGGKRITLKDASEIDGQLIKSVKQTREGIAIELYDKLSALDKLEKYFDVMPADWKQKIEERKLEIMQQKLELDKRRAGEFDSEVGEDGFYEALKETASEVWGNEQK